MPQRVEPLKCDAMTDKDASHPWPGVMGCSSDRGSSFKSIIVGLYRRVFPEANTGSSNQTTGQRNLLTTHPGPYTAARHILITWTNRYRRALFIGTFFRSDQNAPNVYNIELVGQQKKYIQTLTEAYPKLVPSSPRATSVNCCAASLVFFGDRDLYTSQYKRVDKRINCAKQTL